MCIRDRLRGSGADITHSDDALKQLPLSELSALVNQERQQELVSLPEGDDAEFAPLRAALKAKPETRCWGSRISASYLAVLRNHIETDLKRLTVDAGDLLKLLVTQLGFMAVMKTDFPGLFNSFVKFLRPYLRESALDDDLDKENWGMSICLLYTSPSPRDATLSRMPSSA